VVWFFHMVLASSFLQFRYGIFFSSLLSGFFLRSSTLFSLISLLVFFVLVSEFLVWWCSWVGLRWFFLSSFWFDPVYYFLWVHCLYFSVHCLLLTVNVFWMLFIVIMYLNWFEIIFLFFLLLRSSLIYFLKLFYISCLYFSVHCLLFTVIVFWMCLTLLVCIFVSPVTWGMIFLCFIFEFYFLLFIYFSGCVNGFYFVCAFSEGGTLVFFLSLCRLYLLSSNG